MAMFEGPKTFVWPAVTTLDSIVPLSETEQVTSFITIVKSACAADVGSRFPFPSLSKATTFPVIVTSS